MPFKCRYCGQPYCSQHRLPENHECRGLEDYKEQLRERGQLIAETPEVKVEREMSDEPRGGGRQRVRTRGTGSLDGLLQSLQGRVTWALLAAMALVTIGGWLAAWAATGGWFTEAFGRFYATFFALGPSDWVRPWTLLTSIFAHGDPGHLLINGMILFFFGPALEQRVGSRTFAIFFVLTGIAAGLAQVSLGVGLETAGIAAAQPVLGASGAILGILGALTLLAPDAKVLLFFMIPLPLWLITAGYAVIDIAGLIGGLYGQGGNVAHLAHLTGLAIGLYVAHRYWRGVPGGRPEIYTA